MSVELTFFLGNHRRIDLDNLSKAVLDGLNGIVWVDDMQIINLGIRKYVCREKSGVLVRIFENHRSPDMNAQHVTDLVGVMVQSHEPLYATEIA